MSKSNYLSLKRPDKKIVNLNIDKFFCIDNEFLIGYNTLFSYCTIRGSWKEYKTRDNFNQAICGSKKEIEYLIEQFRFNNSFEAKLND